MTIVIINSIQHSDILALKLIKLTFIKLVLRITTHLIIKFLNFNKSNNNYDTDIKNP